MRLDGQRPERRENPAKIFLESGLPRGGGGSEKEEEVSLAIWHFAREHLTVNWGVVCQCTTERREERLLLSFLKRIIVITNHKESVRKL